MPRKRKDISRKSVLLELYENKLLVSKVDEMLDESRTYDSIVEFCKEKFDFNISKSALTRYKQKREEAMETGQDLGDLLDKRQKTGKIVDIKNKEVVPDNQSSYEKAFDAVDKVYNDVEVLDEVIQKGYAGLQFVDVIEPNLMMKAIETKNKITGNQLQGVSLAGLRELRLRQSAKEQAMTEVLMKFIPKEQHEEVFAEIEQAEKEFYENLDLTEENKRISRALSSAGMNIV